MNDTVRNLLDQITALEDKLRIAVQEQEGKLRYTIEGKRIAFEQSVREAHAQLKMSTFRWVISVRPQNYLTAPIIYGMIVPLVFADLCVSFYQATCFPIYKIAKVRRRDYIVFDHRHLAYLNFFEKFHCLYCSYATGFLSYAREIVARTEEYFCPIKHAHKILQAHDRYRRFLAYGDADDYHAHLQEFRAALEREREESKAT
jgi:hypothetical protein